MGYTVTGHCFNVETDDVDEQVKLVLEYFNINVTKDHVFSRCQVIYLLNFVKKMSYYFVYCRAVIVTVL